MKARVAPHVEELPKSGIRKFFDIVARSKDVVSLGIGEPDFDTPWHVSRAAITCIEDGGTQPPISARRISGRRYAAIFRGASTLRSTGRGKCLSLSACPRR